MYLLSLVYGKIDKVTILNTEYEKEEDRYPLSVSLELLTKFKQKTRHKNRLSLFIFFFFCL